MENSFKLKFLTCKESDLKNIGLDKTYIKRAFEKHSFKTLKIFNLTCAQANIIKQTALTCGTDCAVHREVITGKIDASDCILSGSIDELKKIAEKLKYQPLKLSQLSQNIKELLADNLPEAINIRDISISWQEPYIMGILNVTPDSFSDGGLYTDIESAIEHYKELVKNSDIIDIGGESTRPYSTPVSAEEEIKRVIPVIKAIREFDKNTILSIDTRNAITAQKALGCGVDIINDISAMEWDSHMTNIAIEHNCPVIIGHSSATPDIMQNHTNYSDVVEEIFTYFYNKLDLLVSSGIKKSNIIIDPGIGFGKTSEQNFEIINRLEELTSLGCPILVGHSRKNFIKETIKSNDIQTLDEATAILSQKLIEKRVNIIRVHNPELNNITKKLCKSFF